MRLLLSLFLLLFNCTLSAEESDFREGGLGEVDKRKIGFFGRECAVKKQEKKGKQESHGSALVGNIFLK